MLYRFLLTALSSLLFLSFVSDKSLTKVAMDPSVEMLSSSALVQEVFPLLPKEPHLDSQVFQLAFNGYVALKNQGKLTNDSILTIIDYSKPSTEKRMWVINTRSKTVVFHERVAHGKNTGGLYARHFSNTPESHQSSLGFMLTGKIYEGKHPNSLKLHGLEYGFNHKAYDRGIVIHGAHYATEKFMMANGKLGRSYGCPSVRMEISDTLVKTLQGGSCVFSYYPNQRYLSRSSYLKTETSIPLKLAEAWLKQG